MDENAELEGRKGEVHLNGRRLVGVRARATVLRRSASFAHAHKKNCASWALRSTWAVLSDYLCIYLLMGCGKTSGIWVSDVGLGGIRISFFRSSFWNRGETFTCFFWRFGYNREMPEHFRDARHSIFLKLWSSWASALRLPTIWPSGDNTSRALCIKEFTLAKWDNVFYSPTIYCLFRRSQSVYPG